MLSPTRNMKGPTSLPFLDSRPLSFSDGPLVKSPLDRPRDDPMLTAQAPPKLDLTSAIPAIQKDVETLQTPSGTKGLPNEPLGDGRTTQQGAILGHKSQSMPTSSSRMSPPAVLAKQARLKKKPPKPMNGDSTNQPRRGTTISDKKDRLSGILSAEGFCIGTIGDVSGAMDSVVDGKWVKKLGWINSIHNENQVPDVLWRTLVADRGPDGGFAPHWYRRACLHVLADPKITDKDGYIKVSKYATRILGEMTARYLRRVDTVTLKRCIFSSRSRMTDGETLFGLAPEMTKRHDLVCILFGCSVPVILREITGGGEDTKGKYELIGEAYVHGKMQGEAVKEWKKRGIKAQTFHIA